MDQGIRSRGSEVTYASHWDVTKLGRIGHFFKGGGEMPSKTNAEDGIP